MRKTTPVRECMSRLPAEADRRDPLSTVMRHMREQHCHHVPIMDGSHVFGILSSEDLRELAIEGGGAVDAQLAGDVCTRDPLTVAPMTPVIEVAQAMLERGVGSALVEDAGMLVGIFTAADALRLIAAL